MLLMLAPVNRRPPKVLRTHTVHTMAQDAVDDERLVHHHVHNGARWSQVLVAVLRELLQNTTVFLVGPSVGQLGARSRGRRFTS